ncbi:hypothetical protein AAGW05_14755 [Arthrobacter sp. LAPM80]|uniref:hypothetical protein n=1 Tax=Arthrobacter sp. LAPM80 TaxID=3141788 RepID=UPI00398B2DF2
MTDSATPTPPGGPVGPVPRGGKAATTGGVTEEKMPVWLFRTIIGAIAAVVLVVGYLIASVTVPLVWANSIKGQVGGSLGNSIPLGMFYGFTFTFVPILILWQARRSTLHRWARISLAAVGVLLSIPNLMTLGVLYGTTQTSTDARSIWANSANWFGTWSQVFMVIGVVCAVAVIVLGRMWLRRGRKIREIKAAEKLVRDNERAREKAQREAGSAAEKAAKEAARAERRHGSKPTDTPQD